MKKILLFLFAILLTFTVYQSNPYCGEEGSILNVDNIIKNVDPEKITKAEFKEYFKTIEGKKAKGEGIVVNVLYGGKDRYRITVLTTASEPEKGYNVVLFTIQDAHSELKQNDKIIFEGQVQRINPYKGASIDLQGNYKKVGEK